MAPEADEHTTKTKTFFPKVVDLWPAIAPSPRGNLVPYNFLKLHYIRNKMTHISPLAVGAFACNSHVTNVTFKTIKYIGANT